jgi:glycosyltransferase involved in cell wall biosynthesis
MVGSHPSQLRPPAANVYRPKVLHMAPGHWAGHMRIYHRVCMSLVKAGYKVELAAHPLDGERLDAGIQFRSLGSYGPPSLLLGLPERFQRNRCLYRLALRSGADLSHFYSFDFIPWGLQLRRKTGRPVIFDCMEDFEGYALQRPGIPERLRKPLARFVRCELRYAAKHLDAILVSDEGTGKLLQPYAKRLVVLHNYPRLALFPDPGRVPRQKPFDLTYHGSIPRYHLQVCFAIDDDLISRGRQVSWRFMGRMAEKEWFVREVRRRRAGHRFCHLDLVPHDRVADEVLKSKIGIIPLPNLPKFRSNVPQKLFEYMALRMPVVMSDLPPSRPFVAGQNCAFMVAHNAPAEYACAIIRLLDDAPLRFKMGLAGRQLVERRFNWDVESRKLLLLYDELLGTRAR